MTPVKVNSQVEGCPDTGRIGDDEISFRNHYTGVFVPFASYPGSHIPEQTGRFDWFPDMEHFSPENFVNALDYVGWKFRGERYNGRKPYSKVSPNGRGVELESIPKDLFKYIIGSEEDPHRIVMNAQKRMQAFESFKVFSGIIHGHYLSQELEEAGWFWVQDACKDVDRIDIQKMRKMEKIPDYFEGLGSE